MLPSIREILAFGDAGSSDGARLNKVAGCAAAIPSLCALRLPQPEFKRSKPSSIEAVDTTSAATTTTIDERSSTLSNNSSKQRPGRKAGSSDRYTVSPGARQYKCGVHNCAALFKRPEHLKRHMLTHTQARPFRCEARGCGKSFSRRDNFLTHAKKHTADNSASASPPGTSMTAASDDGFPEDKSESDSTRGHKRTASDMTAYDVVLDSSNEDNGCSTGTRNSTPMHDEPLAPRPVSSIFGLLNSNNDGDNSSSPSSPLSLALPPLELLAYASSAQSEGSNVTPETTSAALPLLQQQRQNEVQKDNETFPPLPKKSRQRRASGGATRVVAAAPVDAESGSDPLKPFMCPKCDSRFGRLEHVKRHQLVHTGQRQFKCPTCDKMFARKDNMIQHLRAHERKRVSAPSTPL
ncbi:hypothetical protein EV178_000128 [Coemansia sp. RSA 1646]|nr:hypothetical protein EV178_000128 [Coemansia sp. RSA 1646]KAJ1771456.1 hypothetical protein LPJ74_002275 [Coemansia sp. RSA 1843]KAJ2093174.1 hypothetical protein IW138_000466 [Coemansia sp. RSA 986]KAJ2217561.1 hypothetical protein EV179_000396 [Coemansia sp. RSA 487]